MTMITPSYLGETIEYSSLHACRSTLEDPTHQASVTLSPAAKIARMTSDVSTQQGQRHVQGLGNPSPRLSSDAASSGYSQAISEVMTSTSIGPTRRTRRGRTGRRKPTEATCRMATTPPCIRWCWTTPLGIRRCGRHGRPPNWHDIFVQIYTICDRKSSHLMRNCSYSDGFERWGVARRPGATCGAARESCRAGEADGLPFGRPICCP